MAASAVDRVEIPMNIQPLLQRLSNLGALSKTVLVLAGYVAAYFIASFALDLYIARENPADVQGSPGMFAFGELLYFLFVFCVCAAPPTGLALWFLRRAEAFWSFLGASALLLAATGLTALTLYFIGVKQPIGSTLSLISALAVLRLLACPVLAGAFLLGLLLSPNGQARSRFFHAMAAEGFCAVMLVGYWMMTRNGSGA